MCTYATEQVAVVGSVKRESGWVRVSQALVYFDHPQQVSEDHALSIDFMNNDAGRPTRVAIELTADSARQLVAAVSRILGLAGDLAGATKTEV
jgi:hypothetical protein